MPSQNGNILIVDDNESILSTLKILLTPQFKNVVAISDPGQLLAELEKREFNVVILDMNFRAGVNSGNEGIYWLSRMKEEHTEISVIMMTAYGDVEIAVKALKAGAADFVTKPWDNEKMIATIKMAVQLSLSKREVVQLKERESGLKNELKRDQKFMIGSSPAINGVMNMARKVAKTDANILITGENGTGKDLLAHEIHRLSARSGDVFVSVDMGSLSESLFESELFGHSKGAFTDAHENRQGKFEIADKGTLFLDEIANISLSQQSKLLTAIENRKIIRVGSNLSLPVDIRLICATNRNIETLVEEGLFREDLLYRINTIQIALPPLRERGNDIIVLSDFFLSKFASKYRKHDMRINAQAADKLLNYSWPGNVRELQHTIEKAVILSESTVLKPDDIILKAQPSFSSSIPFTTIAEMENEMIRQALEINNGNLTAAAARLGITRQTLYNKFKGKGNGK